MTSSFKAKVLNIPCEIHLDDNYRIDKIVTDNGFKWNLDVSDEMRLELEFESEINAIRSEDEQDGKDYDDHVKRMMAAWRYV